MESGMNAGVQLVAEGAAPRGSRTVVGGGTSARRHFMAHAINERLIVPPDRSTAKAHSQRRNVRIEPTRFRRRERGAASQHPGEGRRRLKVSQVIPNVFSTRVRESN